DILLGKKLAAAPLAFTLAVLLLTLVQVLHPMRLDHFLSIVPQILTMYLLFCMLANWLSILAPMRLRSGTLRTANARAVPFLLQLAFMIALPFALSPALLPLLIEFVLTQTTTDYGRLPVCLMLSLVEVTAVLALYAWCLQVQG